MTVVGCWNGTGKLLQYGNNGMRLTENQIILRTATSADLEAVNAIVESCVMGWQLPEKVKRLSLSSYRYHLHDLDYLEMLLATLPNKEIVGVAAWEPADFPGLSEHQPNMLLHGLYVAPRNQHQGVGKHLLRAALEATRSQHMAGLLVRAQTDAVEFFRSQGFQYLPVKNPDKDYPNMWWKPAS